MRRRLHIATLGLYHNVLVEHVIAKRGADKIAIIYTEKNEADLDRIKSENKAKGVPVVAKQVHPWDYHDVLSGILEIVSIHEDYEIEYNISCGTRVMTAAAYLAALFTDSPVFFVTDPYEKEKIGKIIMVEPLSVAMLTEPKRRILKRLDEIGGATNSQRDLGSRTDLGASSISKHLNSLDAAGYIARKRSGGKTKVEITKLGRIVLNLKTHRKVKAWSK